MIIYTKNYYHIINNNKIDIDYRNCLSNFIDSLININEGNISSIILYGGLIRDKVALKNWSDIDILVIFKDIRKRNAEKLARLCEKFEGKYHIRIDLSQLSIDETQDDHFVRSCFNGEILNALKLDEDISSVIYGELKKYKVDIQQLKIASVAYVSNTIYTFRRYLIEFVYKNKSDEKLKIIIPRLIRWTFSIIRASLRLFDIYSHPYNDSIINLMNVFPQLDVSLLHKLVSIRKDIKSMTLDFLMVQEIENFLENYIKLVFQDYYHEV